MKKFVVIVNCQGHPFYYFYGTLLSALFGYAKQYLKKRKYNTMSFILKQSSTLNGEIDKSDIKRK